MTPPPLKDIQAMLTLLSRILANGFSPGQRKEIMEKLPVKLNSQINISEYDVYDPLNEYYKTTGKFDFILPLVKQIGATGSFYRDVGTDFNNLLDLMKKNSLLVDSNSVVANIFVITPFKDDFLPNYQDAIKPVAQELGCKIKHVGEINEPDVIIDTIYSEIRQADFLIADATGRNPNVFYELGFAHALNKKVIIIVQDPKDIPFDIARIRYIKYSPDSRELLAEKLRKFIKEILKELPTHTD